LVVVVVVVVVWVVVVVLWPCNSGLTPGWSGPQNRTY